MAVMGCQSDVKVSEAEKAIKEACPGTAPHHIKLGISDVSNVDSTALTVKQKLPAGIDAYGNNARFLYRYYFTVQFHTRTGVFMFINHSGTHAACNAFAPLVKNGGRIANASCRAARSYSG